MKLSAEGKLRLAVQLAFIAGVGTVADSAYAQDSAGQSTKLQGVQVTGSRIKQANLTSSSSMTVISDKELQYQGTTNVESLINSLPQAFAGFSSADSNGASGTATVNLRGLGPQETLVLIDGKRLMPGDPLQAPPSADLNFIPAALIDRIDVLSGGASAVYGSDAVAGVVNFVMKKDFQGFRIDSQASRTDHSDGTSYDTTLIWGNNFSGGKGNVTMYAGYTKADGITQDKRGYSTCSLKTNSAGTARTCSGSGVIAEGKFESYDRFNYNQAHKLTPSNPKYLAPYFITQANNTFIPNDGRTFNFAPYNYIQRPDSRYHLGGFAHDQINSHVDLYGSAMFMDNHTVANVAPTGLFGNVTNIACTNPMLAGYHAGPNGANTGQVRDLCGDNDPTNPYPDDLTNGTGLANVAVLKRLVELGPRISDLRHTDYRIVVGSRGDIVNGITYDVSAQHGAVIFASGTLNYLNTANSLKALNVITGPALLADGKTVNPNAGKQECQSVYDGTDPACVPLNLFTAGGVTPGAVNYIRANGYAQATQVEDVVNATVSADLGKYQVQSPFAKNGVGVAGGWEFRRESLDYRPDSLLAAGSLGGVGGPSPATSGAFLVPEFFGEVSAPLIENAPFAKLLQIDGAYRWSNYSTANDVHSWKTGLKYSPIQDVTLRASFQRATRAPSVNELYTPQAFGLSGGSDPCAGTTPTATAAQCALTGVTAGQYGSVGDCQAGQCNVKGGGNTALKSELSITRSLGIVITPSQVKNLAITVDYFDIYIDGAIGVQSIPSLFSSCFAGNTAFCNGFHRNPTTGKISGDTSTGTNYVDNLFANTGSLRTKGIDFEADYRIRLRDMGLGNNGQFVFNYVSTYILDYSLENAPGLGLYNCAGLYGTTCNGTSNGPNPRLKQKARLTWDSPFGLSLSANYRFIGGVHLDQNTADPNLAGKVDHIDGHIGNKQYVDLSGTYRLPLQSENILFRFGVSNAFGQNPPTVSSNAPFAISSPPFGNGNTFPNVYDALGRVMFVGVTADF